MYRLLFFILFLSNICLAQVQIQIPSAPLLYQIPKDLKGDNLSATSNINWINNSAFLNKFDALNYGTLRWPAGTKGNNFNWKAQLSKTNQFNLKFAVQFAKAHNLNINYMLNYGTITAQEAADFVRFCNTNTSQNQQKRLALLGDSTPIGIKKWELGNELESPWSWGVSWIAGGSDFHFRNGIVKPMQKSLTDSLYYFGGAIWREGWIPLTAQLTKFDAILGTELQLTSPKDTVILNVEYPKIMQDSIRVWVTNTTQTKQDLDANFNQQALYNLFTDPSFRLAPSEYQVLGDTAVKIFPNNQMQTNNVILVEYKSMLHDGAFTIRDSMIVADPSIEIGYVINFSDSLLNSNAFRSRLAQSPPRFLIKHSYNKNLDTLLNSNHYTEIAYKAAQNRKNNFEPYQNKLDSLSTALNIMPKIGLAVTEWNIRICDTCTANNPYQGILSGLYTANFWLQMYEASKTGSLDLRIINHFATIATGDNLLHLFHYRNASQVDSTAQSLATKMVNSIAANNFFSIDSTAISNNPLINIQTKFGIIQRPAIQIYGGFNAISNTYGLILLNIDDQAGHSAQLNIPTSWNAKSAKTILLTGSFTDASLQLTQNNIAVNSNTLNINMPAFSLLSINFSSDVLSVTNFIEKNLVIYPNPVKKSENVIVKGYTGRLPITFKLYNNIGQLIYQKNNITTSSFNLKFPEIKSGLYFYSLKSDSELIKGKLLFE